MAKRFNYQLATVLPKHASRHVDKSRFEQLELGTVWTRLWGDHRVGDANKCCRRLSSRRLIASTYLF